MQPASAPAAVPVPAPAPAYGPHGPFSFPAVSWEDASKESSAAPSPAPSPAPAAMSHRDPLAWDPFLSMEDRMPTRDCIKRVRKDLKDLFKDPLPGIFAVPDEQHATVVHAIITGPFETPYEGGFFYFLINCPDDYPNSPPKVKLLTTGGGRVRFNPNLYANGKVCLSILGTWSGPGWSPVHSIASVLVSIQSLMNERPYHNEPGHEAEVTSNIRDVLSYNDIIRHETLRVAVCEMVEDTSLSRSMPEQLQGIVRNLFPSFYEGYEMTCVTNMTKDGATMVDPFGDPRGIFIYGAMLQRLRNILVALDIEGNDDDAEDEDEEQVKCADEAK